MGIESQKVLPRWYPWMVATGVMAAFTVRWLHYILPFVLVDMAKDFGVPYATMALMSSANTIGLIIGGFLLGLIIDRVGVRISITLAAIIVGLATLFIGLVQDIYTAIILYGIAGLFSWISVAIPKVAREWFSPKLYATASTYMNTGFRVAAIIIGPLVGYILITSGWRAAWIYLGIACVILGVIAYALARDRKDISQVEIRKVRIIEVFKYKELWMLFFAFCLFVVHASLHVVYMATYLRTAIGLDPVTAGGLISIYNLAGTIGLYVILPLADLLYVRRIMYRKTFAALNFIVMAILFTIFALYSKEMSLLGLMTIFAVMGLFAQYVALNSALVSDYFPREVAGTAAGFISAVGHIPWIFIPVIAGYLIPNWTYVWLMIPPSYIIGAILLLLLPKPR